MSCKGSRRKEKHDFDRKKKKMQGSQSEGASESTSRETEWRSYEHGGESQEVERSEDSPFLEGPVSSERRAII